MFRLLRQLGFLAAAAFTCFYVFIVLRGPNGIPAIEQKRQQIERLKQENDELKQEIERRKEHIEHLQSSPEERDRAVRENTGKTKEHETTVILPEGDKPQGDKPQGDKPQGDTKRPAQ